MSFVMLSRRRSIWIAAMTSIITKTAWFALSYLRKQVSNSLWHTNKF
jgi:hypothetical protein